MSPLIRVLVILAVVELMPLAHGQHVDDRISVSAEDWPWWRGPNRNGEANPEQRPPTAWDGSSHVVWKSRVPGRGHSSPSVVGNHVFLATADEEQQTQSVVCYDRTNGKQLWETVVHRGGLMRKNEKSSAASSTVACDGERVFINFANSDAVFVTALALDGKQLWQTKICDYTIHQGFGASPAIYQSFVIAAADSHAGGVLAALDRRSGQIVWKRDRPEEPNYTSPIILNVDGKDQLFLTGCGLFSSFDPLSGETLWEIPGATTECVTSTVSDGKRVFCSGGYPKNHLAAVLADGSGRVAWETRDRVYVPSLLARDGYLFGVLDAGVAACWKSDTGEQMWKERLGGEFSASPVLMGDAIYATSESGETYIFRADPTKYDQIAVNKLGDQVMASMAICGGRIYSRVVEHTDDGPQDMLYCLGEP
ncbi:PQQ-binding-like beta-propeller repeat protein [Lacipirellula limnantheis]|uniref:Outer membrane biogenesis protein BamB n=1 Tax=Lacipirellula limnantheis TaxID=2528024 RepID=A0A517U239_9BACT|nr:PQQ-binding-like beta-propeller repeat protein [Lacipirellula limnantheis]QDT74691.1 outer membrane biogenesis protein BamB [Lacipirellula limnantheis]